MLNLNVSFFHSYNSINMDGTLMRKAMHADPENYVTSMAPGQYWTWGTHMRGVKGKTGLTQGTIAFINTTHMYYIVYTLTQVQYIYNGTSSYLDVMMFCFSPPFSPFIFVGNVFPHLHLVGSLHLLYVPVYLSHCKTLSIRFLTKISLQQ